jgi:hypothetical protein
MASTLRTTRDMSSSHQVTVTTVRAWNMPPFIAIPLVAGPDATSQGQPSSQTCDRQPQDSVVSPVCRYAFATPLTEEA